MKKLSVWPHSSFIQHDILRKTEAAGEQTETAIDQKSQTVLFLTKGCRDITNDVHGGAK